VKALILVSFALALSCHKAVATPSESRGLGLLTNYYHDCPARRGPQAEYVRSTIKRALHGEHAAMRSVIMHNGPLSTGDNEGYSEVPHALLRTLGDSRYAAFVISQRRDVQDAALDPFLDQIPSFARKFPKTSSLYHARFSRWPRNV
jgi:hypothetical protein